MAAPVPPPPPLAAEPNADFAHGYFLGDVATSKGSFGLDALFTVDGDIRMQATGENPWQFAGQLHRGDAQLVGSGYVIGQGCLPVALQPCPSTTGALIRLTAADPWRLAGAIHVADDTWHFDLSSPNSGAHYSYRTPADLESVEGHYEMLLVGLAATERVIMSVDRAGRVFFESAVSGCTGNGILEPYKDSRYNAFQASLVIGNCGREHARLNASFSGLATTNVQTPWDYGDALLMWLATHDEEFSPTAFELRGVPR